MSDMVLQFNFHEFMAMPYLMCLAALFFPNSNRKHRKLGTKELIEKCLDSIADSSEAWDEFKARFDEQIKIFLWKTYSRFASSNNSDEFYQTLKDLKQDVYIKLLDNNREGLRKFKGNTTASLNAYLAVICHNLVLNYVNRRLRRYINDENLDNEVDQSSSPVDDNSTFPDFQAENLKDFIRAVLKRHYKSRKFERDIVIFEMFYFEGFTSKELANRFKELSQSGIETLVSRMKKVLVENYKNDDEN